MDSWDQPWYCGEYDPMNSTNVVQCGCNGKLHMGAVNDQLTGKKLETFDDMRKWKTIERTATFEDNSYTDCSIFSYGGNDPWPGQKKQCWCEVAPQKFPNRCADDGGDCRCNGDVFYMAKSSPSSNSTLSFFDARSTFWTINSVNNTGNLSCKASSFEGVDPLPGSPKQCFCDDHRTQSSMETIQWVKDFWRNKALEKQARAAKVRIEAEADAQTKLA